MATGRPSLASRARYTSPYPARADLLGDLVVEELLTVAEDAHQCT